MGNILVTGAAGFIGYHLFSRLLDSGHKVIGLDNFNDYYDVDLKLARLAQLEERDRLTFFKLDIADRYAMARLFEENRFDVVINLAAQAGVRYSIKEPFAYIYSNITGFMNVL